MYVHCRSQITALETRLSDPKSRTTLSDLGFIPPDTLENRNIKNTRIVDHEAEFDNSRKLLSI